MTPRMLILPLLAILMLMTARCAPAQATDWKEIKPPKLPEFHPQIPRRVVLPNGMVLLLQEDHELPLIDGTLRIRGGSILEPAQKTGLVAVYGEVWRTGGTQTRTGDQMDDFLEARAAKIETGGAAESTSVSFSMLKGDFEDVFKMFLELVQQPAFRENKIELAKNQLYTGIARRNDDPAQIAGRVSTQLAYGKDNPYARVPEYATVAAIGREDLVRWHHEFVHPNNMILGIVGDFDANAMEARVRHAFGDWAKGPGVPSPKVEFHPAKPAIYFAAKEDVNQSEIRMVGLGIQRNNPDYFPVEVLNEAFGGGFSSRLFRSLRTQQGLAYAVGGGIGASYDHPGITRLGIGTKSATTTDAIKGLNEEIDKLLTDPPREDEVKQAKDAILSTFVFNFDSKDKVLREQMTYEFFGYPLDFLERYRAGVEKTTPEDVAQVARKYVHKEQLSTLVVGNPGEVGKQMSSLGPVIPVDISIPPPPGKKAAAPATKTPGKQTTKKVAKPRSE